MLFLAFLYAAALLTLGGAALNYRDQPAAAEFAYSAFFFGGSMLICALFSINMRRHGLSAAAFLAFLAFLSGAAKLFTLLTTPTGPDFSGPAPKLLAAFTIISLLYMAASICTWKKSRRIVLEPD